MAARRVRWLARLLLLIPLFGIALGAVGRLMVEERMVPASDGTGYFAWQQSWITDLDFDVTDDIATHDTPFFPFMHARGDALVVINKYPTGVSQMILPATASAQLAVLAWNRMTGDDVPEDGRAPLVIAAADLAVSAWSIVGLWFLFLTARHLTAPLPAAIATCAIWLGTAAFVYTWKLPLWSHGVSLAALSIAAWASIVRSDRDAMLAGAIRPALLVGFFFAMAIAIRPTHALVLLPLGLLLLQRWIQSMLTRPSGALAWAGWVIAGAIVPLGVEMASRLLLYGSVFFDGYANTSEGFDFTAPYLSNVLLFVEFGPVSGGRGILFAHPIVIIGLAGLLSAMFHWRGEKRWLAIGGWMTFAMTAYLYGSWWFWNLGWSYGARWSSDMAVPMGIGIAWFVHRFHNRPYRALSYLVVLVFWSLLVCS
jgi:hypothetical protein